MTRNPLNEITRRGLETPASGLEIGPAPCDACMEFHQPTQKTCGDKWKPERQYVIGPYGAIEKNKKHAENVAAGLRWQTGGKL